MSSAVPAMTSPGAIRSICASWRQPSSTRAPIRRWTASDLTVAEPSGEEWLVLALCKAAREALARGAPEAAVMYLRRALDEPPSDDNRLDVLIELGRAEALLPVPQDFAALREAIELV